MILLTKSKKGPFLRQFFANNVFKNLNITYQYPESQGKGIVVSESLQPIALTDDDPKQVASVDALAKELGIPIEARRVISPDQKRADAPTPAGERVIELTRDENLCLTRNTAQVQAGLFEYATENFIAIKFESWLETLITQGQETAVQAAAPRALAINFIEDNLDEIGVHFESAARWRARSEGLEDVRPALLQVKEIVISKAQEILEKKLTT